MEYTKARARLLQVIKEIRTIYITGDCKASELNTMKKNIEERYKGEIKVKFELSPHLNIEYDEALK